MKKHKFLGLVYGTTLFLLGSFFEKIYDYDIDVINIELENLEDERTQIENEIIYFLRKNEHHALYYSTAKTINENMHFFKREDLLKKLKGIEDGTYENAIDRAFDYTNSNEKIGNQELTFDKIGIGESTEPGSDRGFKIEYGEKHEKFIENQKILENNISNTLKQNELIKDAKKERLLNIILFFILIVIWFVLMKVKDNNRVETTTFE